MKLKFCLFVAVSAAKSKQPATKTWGDDAVNANACIYSEQDGITTVTTEPGLTKVTKCYKRFQCSGGATVQAKVNQMGLGVHQSGSCMKNFVKLQYSIPRDDFMDFYHWTDHLCDDDLERGWELGKWQNLEEDVSFSFELNDADFYDWFYAYHQSQYDYYAEMGYDPNPYTPKDEIPKFDIQFKCSNVPDIPDEPDTTVPDSTTPVPPTNQPGPTTTTINPNYNTIDQIIENWKEMLTKSSLKQGAKDRTEARFNKIAQKLSVRHEKLLGKKCTFKQMTQLTFGQVQIDYENTCQTVETIINDLENWGADYVSACKDAKSNVISKNDLWWIKYSNQLGKFKKNMIKFSKC